MIWTHHYISKPYILLTAYISALSYQITCQGVVDMTKHYKDSQHQKQMAQITRHTAPPTCNTPKHVVSSPLPAKTSHPKTREGRWP